MRKISLTQLLKSSVAFAGVSATVIDAGLLLADRTGTLKGVPGDWYLNAPLAVWVAVGVPVSFRLASRVIEQARAYPERRITGGLEDVPSPLLHKITLRANGREANLLAHTTRTIFDGAGDEPISYRPAIWRVTVDGTPVVVREAELRAFLDVAYKRVKHQFSRNYWVRDRRPPLYRAKYEAFVALLAGAGLIEGRHADGGASGRLVTHPRFAITYLKHESAFRVAV